MDFHDKTIGFAMCGSFCTFKKAIDELKNLRETGANIIPIMSEISYNTDTRFGKAEDFRREIEEICGNQIIKDIRDAEPIGPKGLLDLLVVLPCTGNSLAKIAGGIADSSVTMLIAVSTNDGLGTAAKNIGALLNNKNLYFLPFSQDDYIKKPNSLVADFSMLTKAIDAAFNGEQLQPLLG